MDFSTQCKLVQLIVYILGVMKAIFVYRTGSKLFVSMHLWVTPCFAGSESAALPH